LGIGDWGLGPIPNPQSPIDVQFTIDPQSGGNGEYFVYLIKGGQKQIIFSNDKKTHGDQGAVIGNSISSKNVEAIIQKVIS
jgi:hypothetical protein